jgi:uncharacterized membrane protein YdjX (TVP38/TMEM64 family)
MVPANRKQRVRRRLAVNCAVGLATNPPPRYADVVNPPTTDPAAPVEPSSPTPVQTAGGGIRENMRGPTAARPGWFRRLGPAGLMAAATLVVPPLGAALLLTHLSRWAEPLRQNPWGPALVVAAFSVIGGFALLPTVALSIFAGWAFGFGSGLATTVLGFAGAAGLSYAVARRAAGDEVTAAVEANPRWRVVRRAILGGGGVRTFLVVALLRLPVVPPFGATSVALAALRVPVVPFLLGTAVGVVPRTAGYVLLASRAGSLNFAAGDDWMLLVRWGLVSVVVIGVITWLGRRALRKLTDEGVDAEAV